MSDAGRARLEALIAERNDQTILGLLGVRFERIGGDETVVAVDVGPRLFQHAGIVHGGVFVLLAESAASIAAACRVDLETTIVSGMEINANHLRPVVKGTLRAVAKPVHIGQTTFVYGIEVLTDDGKLASVSRCTLAIRPRREAA